MNCPKRFVLTLLIRDQTQVFAGLYLIQVFGLIKLQVYIIIWQRQTQHFKRVSVRRGQFTKYRQNMFVVEALYPFSFKSLLQKQQSNLNAQSSAQEQGNKGQSEGNKNDQVKGSKKEDSQDQNGTLQQSVKNKQGDNEENKDHTKRVRSKSQEKQLEKLNDVNVQTEKQADVKQEDQQAVSYLSFDTGDKILVIQAYENGWWYGNTIKDPQLKGFFPSNYVKTGAKPPPPAPPSEPIPDTLDIAYQDSEEEESNREKGVAFVQNQLKGINKGAVQSSYYLGIKGYKSVKIDQKNQNILNGNSVKFDVNTGIARVPIKDQAPAAKSVRQMGYYFDYHQWTEQRNKNPNSKARPDIKKKKEKKLNLKGMN